MFHKRAISHCRRVFGILSSFWIALLLFGTAVPASAEFVKKGPLSFEIELAAKEFAVGVPVPLTVRLTNVSDTPVTVNARFLVNYHIFSEHEVVIHLTGPGKETLYYVPQVFAGEPSEEHFTVLAPGQSVDREIDLNADFDLPGKGKYRVFATYYNPYAPGWEGQLISSRKTFRLR